MYRDTPSMLFFNIFRIHFEHVFSKFSALFNQISFTFVLLSDFLHKYGLLKRIAVLLLGLILAVGVNATMHEDWGGGEFQTVGQQRQTYTHQKALR